MTKEQFISLLRKPATINLNLVKGLEEITEQFPYFQNAHLLLAKQYHGHENIRFESYLRKASAYSSDRKILYDLIKTDTAEVIHITPVTESQPKIEKEQEAIDGAINSNHLHLVTEEENLIQQTEVASTEKSVPAVLPISSKTETISVDPKDIIEQRLRELAGEKKEIIPEPEPTSGPTETVEPIEIAEIPKNAAPINLEDVYATKNGLSEEKEVAPTPSPANAETGAPHSFLEWLKMKSVPVIGIDQYSAYEVKSGELPNEAAIPTNKPGNQLIEKFIKTEPRIVASKSEFYSPGNMARLSAREHEDLISETLARIYAQQGNIRKAIETYHKLALKIPEKSSYFAALIKELEEKE